MPAAARGKAKSRGPQSGRGGTARGRSARSASRRRAAAARARQAKVTARARRRRLVAGGTLLAALGLAIGIVQFGLFDEQIREVTLPLRHEDIIRQQAADKGVEADLIAAVIYAESRFVDQTSVADARGLMQITPTTANEIERRSGGTTFDPDTDLSNPQINIQYGTYHLRELLDLYDGNEVAALAAYNAGPSKVADWGGGDIDVGEIGYPETREYVDQVLEKREQYRDEYRRELGLG